MFFVLSKVLGFFTQPSNLLVVIGVFGAVLLATPVPRVGRYLLVASVSLLVVCGLLPVGSALMLPLEQRFPRWDASRGAPDGIVVLGGAIIPAVSASRGEPALADSAERMTAAVELARVYPSARIVFSGATADLLPGVATEARYAKLLFTRLGIPAGRIELEDRSRNTAENAVFTKVLVNPKSSERWLLVTSAAHMPRAIGAFRQAGFPIEAYPVDWRTRGVIDLVTPFGSVVGGLGMTDAAVHEWVGLLIYWLTDRIPELLPGPAPRDECGNAAAGEACLA
jgi:uncharacterized SAM-binding protein YcdF (DUF218 family)